MNAKKVLGYHKKMAKKDSTYAKTGEPLTDFARGYHAGCASEMKRSYNRRIKSAAKKYYALAKKSRY